MKQKEHFHGSDLEKIEQIYHIKKEDIISFSANVNPLGVSPKLRQALAKNIDVITTYPDREYTSLRNCIGNYCNCSPDNILVGNGCTELISLFIQITKPKNALLLGPTYSEYEREIQLEGGNLLYFQLKEEDNFELNMDELLLSLNEDIDLFIICNPNNPTSSCIPVEQMECILSHCLKHKIRVMVDETYVEFVVDIKKYSSISLITKYSNLIILRGTSKFFAAPGLRLGYAITGNIELLNTINQNKNPWTINSLAVVAGETMFGDTDYIQATRELISSERERLSQIFSESTRYKVYPSYGNFMMLKIMDESLSSEELFDRTIRENLMIRDCSSFPFLGDRFIRFCFMLPKDNDRLVSCLLR